MEKNQSEIKTKYVNRDFKIWKQKWEKKNPQTFFHPCLPWKEAKLWLSHSLLFFTVPNSTGIYVGRFDEDWKWQHSTIISTPYFLKTMERPKPISPPVDRNAIFSLRAFFSLISEHFWEPPPSSATPKNSSLLFWKDDKLLFSG